MTAVRAVAVVIPARDESALIARCLESVLAAATTATAVVVVADSCTDDTAAIARSFGGVEVVETDAGSVGRARALGIEHALRARPALTRHMWIANTDADSVVPAHWIDAQTRSARRASDVLIGTVTPDFADLSEEQRAAWTARHDPFVANGHVHGANLGIRASTYVASGGFAPLAEHEDVDLVARCAALGARIDASNELDVMTSGRSYGRTAGGYARYLREDLVVP